MSLYSLPLCSARITLLLGFFLIQNFLYSQSLYQGPAFGSINGGIIVSTDNFPDNSAAIRQESPRSVFRPQGIILPGSLIDDQYDKSIASVPLRSNEIHDPAFSLFPKQSIHSPAVIIDFDGTRRPLPGWTPPDPHIAAGPNHLVIVDNGRFIIFDKQGNRVKEIYAHVWFGTLVPGSSPFDCQIFYDHFAHRWVQEWLIFNTTTSTSYWLISVSDDDNPVGYWRNYAFPCHMNGSINVANWGDYPKIGYDQQALYISARQLNFTSNYFYYSKLRIISKSQLYDFNSILIEFRDFWDFRVPGDSALTIDGPLIPAVHYDSTETAYLVVDSPYSTSNFITLWQITDPLGNNPIVSADNIPITASLTPPNATQRGGSTLIFSDRRRYRNAVVRNGCLWTANSVAGGSGNQYAFLHYLRLDLTALSVIEDIAFGTDGSHYIYPAVSVDEDENLYLTFTRSGNLEHASAAFTGRRASDPAGLSPSSLLKAGEAYYDVPDPDLRNRWGDYMGIAVDPENPHIIWSFVEYAASPAHTWAVRVGCLTQKYTLRGRIRNAQSGLPVPMAEIQIPETNQITRADSSGLFTLGAPFPSITLDFSAFAYRDTSYSIILTAYGSDSIEIFIQPEIISSISGVVRDNAGNGIASRLEFFAQGNPSPLPYAVALSDTNGYYQVQTIVGVYDIEVRPEAPYLFRRLENISLTSSPLQLDISLEAAEFLLVDDDGNKPYEQYYITALQAFHNTYFIWETDSLGPPPARVREAFPSRLMIWFTGDTSHAPLTLSEQIEIRDHLNAGGRLFLTGQDIAEYSHVVGLLDTLGIAFSSNTALAQVRGIPGSPISNGLVLLIDGSGGADNQHSQDMLTIINPQRTNSIFSYGSNTTRVAGVSYIHEIFGQQAVFLGFGFEAITSETDRQTLLRRILEFMEIPVLVENFSASIPKQIRLFQNYPNPFNPTTIISWQLAVGSHVHLSIYNLQGRRVKTLLSSFQPAGYHSINFDASDLASGIYFYRLEAERHVKTKKMVVLK